MKKFYALSVLALSAALAMSAQSKFNVAAKRYIGQVNANIEVAKMHSRGTLDAKSLNPELDAQAKVRTMIVMKSAGMEDVIEALGVEIESVLGEVVLAQLTVDEMQQVAALDEVWQVALGEEVTPTMSFARESTGVSVAHTPTAESGLNHSYTGEGVVVGMMDTGLDPNHVNFLDADGNPRIKTMWIIKGNSGKPELITGSAVAEYTTDGENDTHATHVLGIMAGSYDKKPGANNGKVAVLKYDKRNDIYNSSVSASNAVPYYGVARDAEIAPAAGSLYDANIIASSAAFRDYVKSTGKPGVMNFSLGSQRGPHDGTDAVSKALASVGEDVLICMSAGNEGDEPISMSKTFTASDNTLRTFVSKTMIASGYLEIWTSNSQALKVYLAAVDKTNGQIKYQYDTDKFDSSRYDFIGGSQNGGYTNVEYNPEFANYFGQNILLGITPELNANGRRHVYLNFSQSGSNSDTNLAAAVIIQGAAGTTVDLYGSLKLYSNGVSGYTDGTPDNSINALACGDNVLVVGAYTNTNNIASLGGVLHFNGSPVAGAIASFSSYGHTFQGRQLPDVCGPGHGIISSYNSYYMNNIIAAGADENEYAAWIKSKTQKNPTNSKEYLKNYWGEMSGTSMSSPFVAGVLALWAQASEEKGERLTMTRVKEIIAKTADKDEFTSQQTHRWGMGKINALAGLKEILGTAAVQGVEADDPERSLIIEDLGGKQYSIFLGSEGFTATLYNMQGMVSATTATSGNEATLDASALTPGVYVLSVEAPNGKATRKLLVK